MKLHSCWQQPVASARCYEAIFVVIIVFSGSSVSAIRCVTSYQILNVSLPPLPRKMDAGNKHFFFGRGSAFFGYAPKLESGINDELTIEFGVQVLEGQKIEKLKSCGSNFAKPEIIVPYLITI